MNGAIERVTLEQFSYLLRNDWRRQITSVHVHHTWKPRVAQWEGLKTVEGIRRYHVGTRRWADIAQHLTIGPDGTLWTGRHLDRAPASAGGHNGTGQSGPFMIEIIGDFDFAQDSFSAVQAQSAYRCIASICTAFSLAVSDVRFHREFNADKSCPGTSLSLGEFRAEVAAEMAKISISRGGVFRSIRGLVPPLPPRISPDSDADGELDCQPISTRGELYDDPNSHRFSDADIQIFHRHVVNTTMGKLSESGHFGSSKDSIDKLIDSLNSWADLSHNPQVVLFAHGGLVSEIDALKNIVLRDASWWLENGVYPIFFVWETGFFEVLFSMRVNSESGYESRGVKDWLLEKLTGEALGRPAWEKIKASAYLASQANTENGTVGGARQFADALSHWLAKRVVAGKAAVRLHAVGHSAGAIFHAHFLPVLDELMRGKKIKSIEPGKPTIHSLSFLAPACRADLFESNLLPMIRGNEGIGSFAQFTMNEQAERDDNVARIYGQSLLYYVRNACERNSPRILGLEESIRSSKRLRRLFGLGLGFAGRGELILSPTSVGAVPNVASQALTHGDFDNDPATMNSVLRRILGTKNSVDLVAPRLSRSRAISVMQFGREEAHISRPSQAGVSRSGIHALCIGIDQYADAPLNGCVRDAKDWKKVFFSMNAETIVLLTDGQATKRGVVAAWRELCSNARRGDTVVIQYAGHGTQVPDKSGDESDNLDEAWVMHDFALGNVLTDDEIGGLIDEFESAGIQFVLITDCCHSGTGTRARGGEVVTASNSRFMRLTDNAGFLHNFVGSPVRQNARARGRQTDLPGPEIHFAGCQDNQSSYESNGRGDFTVAACACVRALRPGMSYLELNKLIGEKFLDNVRQTPGFRAREDHHAKPAFGLVRPNRDKGVCGQADILLCEDRIADLERLVLDLSRKIDELE